MGLSYDSNPSLPDVAKAILDLCCRYVFVELHCSRNEGTWECNQAWSMNYGKH